MKDKDSFSKKPSDLLRSLNQLKVLKFSGAKSFQNKLLLSFMTKRMKKRINTKRQVKKETQKTTRLWIGV